MYDNAYYFNLKNTQSPRSKNLRRRTKNLNISRYFRERNIPGGDIVSLCTGICV